MSFLYIEGFTGIPRGLYNMMNANNPLLAFNWTMLSVYNGTSQATGDDTNNQTTVEADSTFATRNRLSLKSTSIGGAVTSAHNQYKIPLDTRNYEKFVIGMVFNADSTQSNANDFNFIIAGPTMWTSSSANIPLGEIFAQFWIPNDGSNGTVSSMGSSTRSPALPQIKKGKTTHVEILIEQDVDRARIYLDGVLALDYTYTGTFAAAAGGFSIISRQTVAQNNVYNVKVSDMYCFGVDATTPGPFGPSARVLEVAPQSDVAVEMTRPPSYASNSAVLQQNYTAASSDFLTAGDPATDVYGGLDAVAINAATVYGAVFKVYAMSLAEGTHTIAVAAKVGTTNWVSSTTYPLTLGTLKPFVMDVSKNPVTNAAWKPSEIAAAAIGFRLVQ